MNLENVNQFENLFLELKKSTMEEIKLHEDVFTAEKGDEMDQGNIDRDRALSLKLIGRNSFMLKKIDLALLKIKSGTVGICDECDCEIEINRLRARPTATQCITCKEAEEKSEGQILYEKRSHTLGSTFAPNVLPLRRENELYLSVLEN